MATNKNATIRFQALDKCFSNTGKRYYIDDLLAACNKALYEYEPQTGGIKKRQLYEDIRFMESAQGWSIELEKVKDGRKVFYRYANPNFSINKQPLNISEAEKLKSAILVLSRFKGLPQFNWIHELIHKLDQSFNLNNQKQEIIRFETNIYLKGLEYITPLFKAIQNEQTLAITYHSFKGKKQEFIFCPYYLKQYNNRWFLFGKNNDYNNLTNLALDRIINIEHSKHSFDNSQMVDFDEYFDDFIGVTKQQKHSLTKIILKASSNLAPYIITKPLHGSQKKISNNTSGFTFSIDVIPNYELTKLILSLGKNLKVLSPPYLVKEIQQELKENLNQYN